MNLRDRTWKIITAITVALIALNPEMIELALFIDAIGLDLFFMLIEIQAISIFTLLLNDKIKPTLTNISNYIKRHPLAKSTQSVKANVGHLILSTPATTWLMQLLVFSSITCGAITAFS